MIIIGNEKTTNNDEAKNSPLGAGGLPLSHETDSRIYLNHPDIRFGKPCIKGTRIAVTDILNWLASGMTQEEILSDYPALTKEHILACFAFAANREGMIKIIAA